MLLENVQSIRMVHGLVQPIYEQANVLANHLLDELVTNLPPAIYSTKLKANDISIYSAGSIVNRSLRFSGDLLR